MVDKLKKQLLRRLEQLEIVLATPGALKARTKGCYFEIYRIFYRLYKMGLRPNTMLDIGANRGMFVKCAHYVFPNSAIYAFEPLKHCYEELCRLKTIIPHLECFNVGLGKEETQTFIHRNNYDYSSSLLEMENLQKEAFPYTSQESLEKVEIRTLDLVLRNRKIERPLLMKIDVQGYESFVLDGAAQTLCLTDYIICEMSFRSLYKGQALFNDIYEKLLKKNFRFVGQLGEICHSSSGEVLQIDGLFINASNSLPGKI
ncbi:MAG: FkbM family methyltransferase [Chitinispirillaceae bacterium]|jgi:FkbM family methyltransferase